MRKMDLNCVTLVFETDTAYIQHYNVKHKPEEREQAQNREHTLLYYLNR